MESGDPAANVPAEVRSRFLVDGVFLMSAFDAFPLPLLCGGEYNVIIFEKWY